MSRATNSVTALLLGVLMPAALSAQLGSFNPRPGPQGTFAIRNAHIFPVSGPEIVSGTIVISGGKITAIGAIRQRSPPSWIACSSVTFSGAW